MEDGLNKEFVQTRPVLNFRPSIFRWVTFCLVFLVMTAIIVMGTRSREPSYSLLMSNLIPEDTANIIRVLREKQILFKLDSSGKNISVPTESLYQARADLAVFGLPQSGGVGYEIFDKQALGTTSYVQKINQKRALEGELMRTINQIHGIRRSRVHLAIPQKSVFLNEQKKSTASVALDLDSTVVLNQAQVSGIASLIARAVEGMEVSDVVIVDSNGKTLSQNINELEPVNVLNQHDYQHKIETEIEEKIEKLLGRLVGEGHVAAKVIADLALPVAGDVKRLSVTVVVDGKHVKSYGKDGSFETRVESWSQEKLKEFEEILTSAIGLDVNRGDTLDIKNMEFVHDDAEDGHPVYTQKTIHSDSKDNFIYGFIGLLIGVFCLLLFRPLVRLVRESRHDRIEGSTAYSSNYSQNVSIDELGLSIQRNHSMTEGTVVRDRIIDLIDSDPHKAALIIKDWLKTGKLHESVDDPQEDIHGT